MADPELLILLPPLQCLRQFVKAKAWGPKVGGRTEYYTRWRPMLCYLRHLVQYGALCLIADEPGSRLLAWARGQRRGNGEHACMCICSFACKRQATTSSPLHP
jgi:hypothetical protein